MSWDLESNKSSNSNKREFTKFPQGITRIIVLDKSPQARWTHFLLHHKRSINCPGRACPICEIRKQQKINKEPYTYAMGKRFSMNIYNLETGKIEIMEQGKEFFEQLRDLKDELENQNKELNQTIIKVKRRGAGKDDTSYRLDVDTETNLPNLSEETLSKLTDLSVYFTPHSAEQVLRVISGEKWEDVMVNKQNDANNKEEGTEEEIEEEIELK